MSSLFVVMVRVGGIWMHIKASLLLHDGIPNQTWVRQYLRHTPAQSYCAVAFKGQERSRVDVELWVSLNIFMSWKRPLFGQDKVNSIHLITASSHNYPETLFIDCQCEGSRVDIGLSQSGTASRTLNLLIALLHLLTSTNFIWNVSWLVHLTL